MYIFDIGPVFAGLVIAAIGLYFARGAMALEDSPYEADAMTASDRIKSWTIPIAFVGGGLLLASTGVSL